MKRKLLLSVSIVAMCGSIGATILCSSGLKDSIFYALNRNSIPGSYTLTLNASNHLQTVDGGLSYYSSTSSGNKVYFDWDDTADIITNDGWMSLVSGGTFDNPTVWNTSKIKGMKSIRIVSDYNNLKLHYGCEVDGEIVYSNYIEYHTTTIEKSFTPGNEPSYFKIEGYTGTNANLLESVTIEYSCSESEVTSTENLSYELIEGKQEYRILGFTDRKENSTFY